MSLNISTKLWLLAFSAALGIAILTVVSLLSEKALIIEERKDSLRHEVETAYGLMVHFQELAAKGGLPEADAKRSALDAVRALRYGDAEYFWVNDMQPRMVMHPIKPELDGTDLTENKDPTGKQLFVEFVNTV